MEFFLTSASASPDSSRKNSNAKTNLNATPGGSTTGSSPNPNNLNGGTSGTSTSITDSDANKLKKSFGGVGASRSPPQSMKVFSSLNADMYLARPSSAQSSQASLFEPSEPGSGQKSTNAGFGSKSKHDFYSFAPTSGTGGDSSHGFFEAVSSDNLIPALPTGVSERTKKFSISADGGGLTNYSSPDLLSSNSNTSYTTGGGGGQYKTANEGVGGIGMGGAARSVQAGFNEDLRDQIASAFSSRGSSKSSAHSNSGQKQGRSSSGERSLMNSGGLGTVVKVDGEVAQSDSLGRNLGTGRGEGSESFPGGKEKLLRSTSGNHFITKKLQSWVQWLTGDDVYGDTIESYYLKKKVIGTGSFGTVYVAYPTEDRGDIGSPRIDQEKKNQNQNDDDIDPTLVALKEIKKSSVQPSLLARFESEVMALALEARHPHVQKYVKFFEDPLRIYIVMELYHGMDLFDYCQTYSPLFGGVVVDESNDEGEGSKNTGERISEHSTAEQGTELIIFYARQMLAAICYIHGAGIIHRDIKPDNFVFGRADCKGLRLIDFGCATIDSPRTAEAKILNSMIKEQNKSDMGVAGDSGENARNQSTITSKTISTQVGSHRPDDEEENQEQNNVDQPEESPRQRLKSAAGSLGFCAPEVFTHQYSYPADIFSFGVTLSVLAFFSYPYRDCSPGICKGIEDYQTAICKDGLKMKSKRTLAVHVNLELGNTSTNATLERSFGGADKAKQGVLESRVSPSSSQNSLLSGEEGIAKGRETVESVSSPELFTMGNINQINQTDQDLSSLPRPASRSSTEGDSFSLPLSRSSSMKGTGSAKGRMTEQKSPAQLRHRNVSFVDERVAVETTGSATQGREQEHTLDLFYSFLKRLANLNPRRRPSAKAALEEEPVFRRFINPSSSSSSSFQQKIEQFEKRMLNSDLVATAILVKNHNKRGDDLVLGREDAASKRSLSTKFSSTLLGGIPVHQLQSQAAGGAGGNGDYLAFGDDPWAKNESPSKQGVVETKSKPKPKEEEIKENDPWGQNDPWGGGGGDPWGFESRAGGGGDNWGAFG